MSVNPAGCFDNDALAKLLDCETSSFCRAARMHRLDRAVNEGNLENHFTALPIRRSDDQHIVITRTKISITQPTRTRRRGGTSFGLLFGCCGNSGFPLHFPPCVSQFGQPQFVELPSAL